MVAAERVVAGRGDVQDALHVPLGRRTALGDASVGLRRLGAHLALAVHDEGGAHHVLLGVEHGGRVGLQRCGRTCSGRPTSCICRGHMWLQLILLAKPARWPSQPSGMLHTASPSAPLKEHLPEAISNPAAHSRHPPPASVSVCKPLSNTPLTGTFTTPQVLGLAG